MAYIPDPTDITQPVDSVKASTAAAEFRSLKQYIAMLAGLNPNPALGSLTVAGTVTAGGIIAPGVVAQRVVVETQSLGSSAANIPFDDTIPQSNEGDQWLSTSFTPTNAASSIYVTAVVPVYQPELAGIVTVLALFTSESADAKALAKTYNGTASNYDSVLLIQKKLTGWAGARTVSVRVGASAASLFYLNGRPTPYTLGRKETSYLEIIEVLP